MGVAKIIFLVGGPLTKRWLFNYRIDELAQSFDVEYWDCSPMIKHPYHVTERLQREYAYQIDSYEILDQRLAQQPWDAILIPEIGFCEENYPLLKRIAAKIRYCLMIDIWSYNLLDYVDGLRLEGNHTPQHSFCPKRLVKSLLRKLRDVFKPDKQPHHTEVNYPQACRDLFEIYEISYKPTAQYSINHVDYEKYLEVKAQPKRRQDKYIVYVGQYFPLHPEYAMIEPDVDFPALAEPFYKSLNAFFDRLEDVYQCPVVIAEHPSGNNKGNPYSGREVVFYQTAELIRDSYAVCMHCTNAFSMVALFDKPVSILTCNALRVSRNLGGRTEKFASILKTPLVDMDKNQDLANIFNPMGKELRENFLSVFVDTEREQGNAELLQKHIRAIHNEIILKHNTK